MGAPWSEDHHRHQGTVEFCWPHGSTLAYRPSTVSLDDQLVGIFTLFWRGCFDVEKMLVIQVAQQGGMFRSWKQSKCWSNTMYLTNWWLHKLSWLLWGDSCHQYTIYVYIYMYIYIYIHIYVCMYVCMYVCIHMYINTTVSHHIIYIYTRHMYIYVCVSISICIYNYRFSSLYIIFHVSINLLCIYIYTYIYVYIYIRISICQYIYRYEGFQRWRCPKMDYRIDPIKMI